jgi:hypothetical protein
MVCSLLFLQIYAIFSDSGGGRSEYPENGPEKITVFFGQIL